MAAPSYTYALTNGTTADASQVTQNFADILNGVSDGTKDLSINALTCAGTATLNGHVNLGNAAADDLTITASLAATLPIKTNTSFDIGSATLGLRAVYLGGTSTFTGKVLSATLAASRIWTIPDTLADASFVMTAGAQTIAGAKTFSSGIVVGGNATGDSNLGTISSVTYTKFYKGSFTATWAAGGPFVAAQTQTVSYVYLDGIVTLLVPAKTASAATAAGTSADCAAATVPSSLIPGTAQRFQMVEIRTAGTEQQYPGFFQVSADGSLTIRRDNNSTVWGTTATNGWSTGFAVTYYVG